MNIGIISDMHAPYHHPDTLEFLKAIKKKYKPDRWVCLGDELDYHAISFHDADPALLSAQNELDAAKEFIQELHKLIPKMDIIESNHGSLVFRKQMAAGLPYDVFKSYNEILEVGKGWKWHFDLTLKLSNGQHVYFHHGKNANISKLSQAMGMNAVQGHYHEKFTIDYWGNPLGLWWGLQCGCLIDFKSLAFAYNKNNLKRPIIGTGMIINDLPVLIPMVLNKKGRWNGKI